MVNKLGKIGKINHAPQRRTTPPHNVLRTVTHQRAITHPPREPCDIQAQVQGPGPSVVSPRSLGNLGGRPSLEDAQPAIENNSHRGLAYESRRGPGASERPRDRDCRTYTTMGTIRYGYRPAPCIASPSTCYNAHRRRPYSGGVARPLTRSKFL